MGRWLVAVYIALYPALASSNPELELGLKGGLSAATQAGAENRQHAYGLSGGLASWLRWALTPRVSLAGQLELLYVPRGADVVDAYGLQAWHEIPYFDMTLAVRPEVRFGRMSGYLVLGAGASLMSSATLELANGWRQDTAEVVRDFDVSLLVGAGVAWRLPHRGGAFRPGAMLLELRHDHGLLDTYVGEAAAWRNRTTSIMFGLSFVLGAASACTP